MNLADNTVTDFTLIATTPAGVRISLGTYGSEAFARHVRTVYEPEIGDEYTSIEVVPADAAEVVFDDPGASANQ